jgi:SAM-dependent methyltransferase
MTQSAECSSSLPGVAEEVRDFYDHYPYPPPVESLDTYRRTWLDPERRRADYHLFWPDRDYRESYSILVAGCGTSQAAKHAMRWPEAEIIGVDVSATSVQCTKELKQRYNLANLQVYQLPIDRLSELDKTFDQIVCTGVLHHLEEPDGGLAALRRVLKRDGAMHLMLYAPYGRAGIYMLQDFCRRTGIRATDEGIRDLIAALRHLPAGHPLESLLRLAPDFREETALADALLHPQDRAYSVPEFFEFLERGRMKFARWIRQAPYSPHCGVMTNIPQATHITKLPKAEQYAATELFRGTMVRHSAIVYRDDRSPSAPPIDFAGNAWLQYVPISMSETICVQERLPRGAEAVLINRTHAHKDLFMAVSQAEKRLFDAIDGHRTIAEILAANLPREGQPGFEMGRTLFERLWWHDQVVFDASANQNQNSSAIKSDSSLEQGTV